VARNLCLLQASRISTKKRDLRTNRKGAKPAAMPAKIPEAHSAKCLTLSVLPAENPAEYRFSQPKDARSIAAIASQNSGNSRNPENALFGAYFFYAASSALS
jgi:hypothetical protein